MEIELFLSLTCKAITVSILVFQILQKQKVYSESKYRIKKNRSKITWLSKLVMPNLSFSVQYFEMFLFLDSFSQCCVELVSQQPILEELVSLKGKNFKLYSEQPIKSRDTTHKVIFKIFQLHDLLVNLHVLCQEQNEQYARCTLSF